MRKSIRSYQIEKQSIKLSKEDNFFEDKRVITHDEMHVICVDTQNLRWSYYNSETRYSKIFNYDQLIDFELVENGDSVIQGRTGSTIVGNFLFGGVGAIAGAAGSRKIFDYCSELTIKLIINDMDNPFILINLIDTRTKKSDKEYQNAINKAIEFESLLKIIMANDSEIERVDFVQPSQLSKKEQLQEIKEMLDSGLITQEDYEQKKKQILGL
jgi:hypothetical protein